ncbi:alpha/beta fold hydrolase [uncultured Halopseudomonas sp.]|uniref:alpha/beta hydrolase family protein n=1 Tax=uncultured Halopseudomonas sp. TaxID=2901193 RepID=UPI0030EDA575
MGQNCWPEVGQINWPLTVPRGTIIIAPAVAATQSFYAGFAVFLSSQGFDCLTFDYRGSGCSLSESEAYDIRLEDWGKQDIEAVIRFAAGRSRNVSENHPVYLIGHSIGGQLLGLARSSRTLSGIVHVAVSAPYWRRWPYPLNARMLAVSRIVLPVFSAFRDRFPSRRLGLGGMDIPASAVRQWARWMRCRDYLFDPRFGLDLSGYKALEQPLLSIGFSDDVMAPFTNIEHILTKFPNARVTRRHVDVSTLQPRAVGHAGFFKPRFEESLWRETFEWLTATDANIQGALKMTGAGS